LVWGGGVDQRRHRVEGLDPLALYYVEVDRFHKVKPREVLRADPPALSQQFQKGQRGETRVLATTRPAQGAEHQHVAMEMERVQDVARLVTTGEGEHLVDGEVDGMEQEPNPVVVHRRHEPPSRVASPLDLGR